MFVLCVKNARFAPNRRSSGCPRLPRVLPGCGCRARGAAAGGGGGEVCARLQRGSRRCSAGLTEPPGPAVSPLGPGAAPNFPSLSGQPRCPRLSLSAGKAVTHPGGLRSQSGRGAGSACSDLRTLRSSPRCHTDPLTPVCHPPPGAAAGTPPRAGGCGHLCPSALPVD